MSGNKGKGIFCLETDWQPDLRIRTTVGPILDLLEKSNSPSMPYIRRDIGTVTEFEHYLKIWTQRRYDRYPILYLGFHGASGMLEVGRGPDGAIGLDWLEECLGGTCKNRLVHFGSCGTLATSPSRLNQFLRETGALAVSGYRKNVDWMPSAAFEILLFYELQFGDFTRRGLMAARRRVSSKATRLAENLGFQMVVAPAARKRKRKSAA